MNKLDHPNIVKLYRTFEDIEQIHLISEYCKGGELLDKINSQNFSEENAAKIFFQMVKAVEYLHKVKSIVHRDVKPENFMFKTKECQ